MFDKVQRCSVSFLPVVLTALLLVMGCMGMLGVRLPHSQHRPTPSVQRAGYSTEMVAALHTPPYLPVRVKRITPPRHVARTFHVLIVQPLLADAPLQTRAP